MIFVDSGAFFARFRQSDEHYAAANYSWRQVGIARTPCTTTDLVVAEMLTLFGRAFGSHLAAEGAISTYSSDFITVVRPERGDELKAVDLLEKFAVHPVHFVDCVSFVMMRRHKLRRVFGFDRHFQIAGFELWRGK